jgi:glycosyltransferase involved in cell wall biosynthesis
MKILFVVYENINRSARAQNLLSCARQVGDVVLMTFVKPDFETGCPAVVLGEERHGYIRSVAAMVSAVKAQHPFDVLYIYNCYNALFERALVRSAHRAKTVVDWPELYVNEKGDGLSLPEKLANWQRPGFFRKIDVISCANACRARVMKERFRLTQMPIVYENIRFLDAPYDTADMERQYGELFRDQTRFYLLASGGISVTRLTRELIQAVTALGEPYRLYFLGSGTQKDRAELDPLIDKSGNVKYLGMKDMGTLRYFISRCHAGVVTYAQKGINDINCASGKVYEYVQEGKPIVASENPPLKELCEQFGIGISSNDFMSSIPRLRADYGKYAAAATDFKNTVDIEEKNSQYARELAKRLHSL